MADAFRAIFDKMFFALNVVSFVSDAITVGDKAGTSA
jgi:hypothetical protein